MCVCVHVCACACVHVCVHVSNDHYVMFASLIFHTEQTCSQTAQKANSDEATTTDSMQVYRHNNNKKAQRNYVNNNNDDNDGNCGDYVACLHFFAQ